MRSSPLDVARAWWATVCLRCPMSFGHDRALPMTSFGTGNGRCAPRVAVVSGGAEPPRRRATAARVPSTTGGCRCGALCGHRKGQLTWPRRPGRAATGGRPARADSRRESPGLLWTGALLPVAPELERAPSTQFDQPAQAGPPSDGRRSPRMPIERVGGKLPGRYNGRAGARAGRESPTP
jgi:hypothetical protein